MGVGYVVDVEKATLENRAFRRVLFTGPNAQLVLMCLKPNQDIGLEMHAGLDQFIRVERGSGHAVIGTSRYDLHEGDAIVVPQHTPHNVIASEEGLELYTVYTHPDHPDGQVQMTKEEAEKPVEKSMRKETQVKELVVLQPSEYVLYKSGMMDLPALYKSKMPKKGHALDTKEEWRTAHRTPPKEYREEGAKKQSDYAMPGYRYPIDTPEHVRAAIRYLAKKKNQSYYPPSVLAEGWRKIRRAAKKFGISVGHTKGEGGKKK